MSAFAIQDAATFEPNKVGAWKGIPMDVYHKLPGESNSRLGILEQSPLRYRKTCDGLIEREETQDMALGTILHTIVAEGRAPDFHIKPDTYGPEKKKWRANANECKAWLEAHADKPILSSYEAAMIGAVSACVLSDSKASRLIKNATPEVSACAYNPDLDLTALLRVRFDLIGCDDRGWWFADVKSTRDASTEAFSREILKRKYHAQLALYRRVLRRLVGDDDVRAYIIPIEKDRDVPRVNVRQVSPPALKAGDAIVDDRLRLLKRCKLSNTWPALPDDEGHDEIPFIDLPDYAFEDDIEISTEEVA